MTQATLAPGPTRTGEEHDEEPGLVGGRPIEDRSFELVEVAAGAAAGMLIGSAVAGPVGTVVGGVAGAAVGIVGGEAVERRAGRAATTTDAGDDHAR
jgi:outer membrane lipoprotein SlyB